MKSDDVDRLIEQRKAQALEALDEMVAENQRLGLYDDTPEVTPEVTPYADNSAHKAENVTGTVDAVNMSQDRVDETAKGGHEWVGLTDAEIAQTMHGSVEGSNMLPYQFARAIEAKLKEKNT